MTEYEKKPAQYIDGIKPCGADIEALLKSELARFDKKIVVLDDDPTGVQTVNGIYVYTNWKPDTLVQGFKEEQRVFFILTNSRSFTEAETVRVHGEIAENIVYAARETGKDFIIISRSDSTLRGHYPTETKVLAEHTAGLTSKEFHGEIIMPFFKEGGRFTVNNVHYVKDGGELIPAGNTEFARDKTFGYKASHLGEWCEEKTGGVYKAADMIYISLDSLRLGDFDTVEKQLTEAEGFNKIIVNAVDYADVRAFAIPLIRAMRRGKRFMFRSAAALVKILGGVPDKPLLTKNDLILDGGGTMGGVILVGSHVNKTSKQLDELKNCAKPIAFIAFNQHLVLEDGGLEREAERVSALAESKIRDGVTAAIYTRREKFDLPSASEEEQLVVSTRISGAVTSIIGKLTVKPRFIIAKGGITSSDVGTKALGVTRALVMGQIRPGVPVWMTGSESKFPGMPYIIFPGNVGEIGDLRSIAEELS